MENKYWFEEPTQVRAYDGMEDGEPCFMTGIAYKDEFICACCGGVFEIDEIYAAADEDKFTGTVILCWNTWVDFTDCIGDDDEA